MSCGVVAFESSAYFGSNRCTHWYQRCSCTWASARTNVAGADPCVDSHNPPAFLCVDCLTRCLAMRRQQCVRVWWNLASAGTLALGLRKAPEFAPGWLSGWVTACGWRRPSRPRDVALFPNSEPIWLAAQTPPPQVGCVWWVNSVSTSV